MSVTAKPMPRHTDPAPDGAHWDEYDDPAEWVDKLPPERHVPFWDDLSQPKLWICPICSQREEGVVYSWPCAVAAKHGLVIAETYGWEAAR